MNNVTIYKDELNRINNSITRTLLENVDEETGEINEAILDQLNAMELKKEELITVLALSFHEYNAHIQSIKNDPIVVEAQRKLALAKQYEQSVNSLKNLLARVVPEGEKIENEHYKIGWRKSSVVEVDELECDLEKIHKNNPALVEVEYKLKKTEVKNYWKSGKTLPIGISIEEKQNLQVK